MALVYGIQNKKTTEQTEIHSNVAIVNINVLDNAKRLLLYLWICLKRLVNLITIYYLPKNCVWLFNAIKLVQSDFSEGFQRVNVNNSFSECCKICLAVPQGSIICPFLFNIFLKDIFHLIEGAYICIFADNDSLYLVDDNLKDVKTIVKKNFKLVQLQFYKNCMVLNPEKCHYLIRNKNTASKSIKLGKKALHAEAEQKLLGKIIDEDLKFQNHTKSIIKKR